MKRTLMLTLATSLCIAGLAASQGQFDTFVPDRDPSQGGCLQVPFDPVWQRAAGEVRFQQFIPAAALRVANRFTDLSIAPCTAGTFGARAIEVRLSHTAMTSLSAIFNRNLPRPVTVLKRQNHKIAMQKDKWTPLHFDCPFEYDGRNNLVIEVRYTGGVKANFDGSVHVSRGIETLYASGPNAFGAVTGQIGRGGFKLRMTNAQIWYGNVGGPQPGNFVVPIYDNSAGGNRRYVGVASFAGRKLVLGCWKTDVTFDALFVLTLLNRLPNIFVASHGQLSDGVAKTRVDIPSIRALIGVEIFQNFATLERGQIQSIAKGNSFTIRR